MTLTEMTPFQQLSAGTAIASVLSAAITDTLPSVDTPNIAAAISAVNFISFLLSIGDSVCGFLSVPLTRLL